MNVYILSKALHVISAFALVGPLMLAPRWLYLARHEAGQAALQELHRLTGIAGWLVLFSGGVMLFLQWHVMLNFFWMQSSIGLFIAIQLFDHFWADRREEEYENDPEQPTSALKIWLFAKLGFYGIITMLMVAKP